MLALISALESNHVLKPFLGRALCWSVSPSTKPSTKELINSTSQVSIIPVKCLLESCLTVGAQNLSAVTFYSNPPTIQIGGSQITRIKYRNFPGAGWVTGEKATLLLRKCPKSSIRAKLDCGIHFPKE